MATPDAGGRPGAAARAWRALRDALPRAPWWQFWPALLGPAAAAFVGLAWALDWRAFLQKGPHETAAVVLTTAAVSCWLARAWRDRDPVAAMMTFLSLAFLLREIHFEGSDQILDAMLLTLLVWGWLWRRRLPGPLARGRRWPWLVSTAWTYLFSQLVARRVFKGLPLELDLHVWVEEVVENVAHVMLIVSAFADLLGRGRGSPGGCDEPDRAQVRPS